LPGDCSPREYALSEGCPYLSEQNYRDLKLAGVGKTLKKSGRKPGSTTTAAAAPGKRRPRQNRKPAVTA
jgi:hypothetical protein